MATVQTTPASPKLPEARRPSWACLLLWMLGLFTAMGVVGALLLGYALLVVAPNLPSPDATTDYRPKTPLHACTADNVLTDELGEEHCSFMPIT